MWNGGVGRVFFFFLQGFAFMATHRGLCTLIVKLYAHTQLPLSRGFFIRVLISVASVHNSALLLFCRSIFFSFFFHYIYLFCDTARLDVFCCCFRGGSYVSFLSADEVPALSFTHCLRALCAIFLLKQIFHWRCLALLWPVACCGFLFAATNGMLQGWLPRGRALRKT